MNSFRLCWAYTDAKPPWSWNILFLTLRVVTTLYVQKLFITRADGVPLVSNLYPGTNSGLVFDSVDRLEETLSRSDTSHRVNGIAVEPTTYGPHQQIVVPKVIQRKDHLHRRSRYLTDYLLSCAHPISQARYVFSIKPSMPRYSWWSARSMRSLRKVCVLRLATFHTLCTLIPAIGRHPKVDELMKNATFLVQMGKENTWQRCCRNCCSN